MSKFKDFIDEKFNIKRKKRVHDIKLSTVDCSVYDGLTDKEIVDLWDKYYEIMNELLDSEELLPFLNSLNNSKVRDKKNYFQNKFLKMIQENPRLIQLSVTDTRYPLLFDVFCRFRLDDLVYYIASDEKGQKVLDEFGNNIAMIASMAGRSDIAAECLRNGFVDPMHQNDLKETLGHLAVVSNYDKGREELLKLCVCYEKMCALKDDMGRNVLLSQLSWMGTYGNDDYINLFIKLLYSPTLRKGAGDADRDIWDKIDGNIHIRNNPKLNTEAILRLREEDRKEKTM